MKRRLKIGETLHEFLRRLPPSVKKRVGEGLDEISRNPHSGKPLSEELEGYRSYRAGTFRIIYREEGSLIEIKAVGSRRTIYQAAALALKLASKKP